jgi:site-specific DNA-cytosine methylase
MRGLLDAGHDCTGVELLQEKAHLSKLLNPDAKAHIVANVLDLDMEWVNSFDAVWASPPCQSRSMANKGRNSKTQVNRHVNDNLLQWSLGLTNEIVWVENVIEPGGNNAWGSYFNAAQFLKVPVQNRQRVIGGRYTAPSYCRGYKPEYSHDGWRISPATTASMYKRIVILGKFSSGQRFGTCETFYGYVPTLDECAHLQGLEAIPLDWYDPMNGYSWSKWQVNLYEGIGNGVPVYMARAFGEAYSKPIETPNFKQLELFERVAA